MRAFITISIPPHFRQALADQASDLGHHARELRVAPADNLHLTLAFLGEVPPHTVDSVQSGMEAAAVGHYPFDIGFGGGGTFPRRGEPRVAWVGVTGDLEAAQNLQSSIAREMRQLHIRVAERPFSPHVTLARISRQATPSARIAIARRVEAFDLVELGHFTVSAISLMESDLVPSGAVYRHVLDVELGTAAAEAPSRSGRFRIFGDR